jgi:hypothetical protein
MQEIPDAARAELAGILLSRERPPAGATRCPQLAERYHGAVAEQEIVSGVRLRPLRATIGGHFA